VGVPVVLVSLALIALAGHRIMAGHDLANAKQRVRDRGEPATYAELNTFYSAPPEGENRADVLLRAMDAFVGPDESIEERIPFFGDKVLPHRTEPIAEPMLTDMRTFLAGNAESIALVFEALDYARCRFPITLEDGPATEFPHLAPTRQLGRLLAFDAVVAAVDGDTQTAARDVVAIFDLADSLNAEPVLISQLVRLALYDIAITALEQAVNRAAFSEVQLAAIQNRLVEATENRSFINGLIGERCMWNAIESIGVWGENLGGNEDHTSLRLMFTFGYRPSGFLHAEGVRWFQSYDAILGVFELPIEDRVDASDVNADRASAIKWRGIMSAILIPAVAKSPEADVRVVARARAAYGSIAILRHAMRHEALPETLSQIDAEVLQHTLIDPYGGALLCYVQHETGFTLYSRAKNLVDDGGVESESVGDAWREGDLTFAVERAG
jgi:hypothetical protein